MTSITNRLAAFAAEKVEQLPDNLIHIVGPTAAESAALLREFADMVEKGETTVQRLSMSPRTRDGEKIYHALTAWFSSVEK